MMKRMTPSRAAFAARAAEHGRKAGPANLRALWQRPKCTAVAKATGVQCGNPGMGNGKCRLHGGLSPKGENWGRIRPPEADTPREKRKYLRRLENAERRRQRQEAVRATLPDEERAWREKRSADFISGSKPERAAVKADKASRAWARDLFNKAREAAPKTAERELLESLLDRLERAPADDTASNVFD